MAAHTFSPRMCANRHISPKRHIPREKYRHTSDDSLLWLPASCAAFTSEDADEEDDKDEDADEVDDADEWGEVRPSTSSVGPTVQGNADDGAFSGFSIVAVGAAEPHKNPRDTIYSRFPRFRKAMANTPAQIYNAREIPPQNLVGL